MTTRHAGLALMAGIIACFIGSMLMPGTIIGPVDQTDFPLALQALGDSAVLAHWMTLITIISLLLMTFGLLSLFPLARRQGGLGGSMLQIGIIITVIEWSSLVIAGSMRHFAIHLMQRAGLGDFGSLTALEFTEGAVTVYTVAVAVTLTFVATFPFGSALTGIGLSLRFASMGVYKIASYMMVLCGLVGLVNFLIALSVPDLGLDLLMYVNTVALYIGGIGLFITGLGMYRGRAELSEEGDSG